MRSPATPRPGHEHDEGHVRRPNGRHRRYESPLRVAGQADLRGVHVGAGLQVGHARQHVGGEVGGSGGSEVAPGLAHAPVVESEHRQTAARQMVRQHQEGPVPQQGLVSILRTGPRDEEHGWERTVARRPREGARQRVAFAGVGVGHVLGVVGKGLVGVLGPSRRRFGLGLRASLQHQRQRLPGLREGAVDRGPVVRQNALERHRQGRNAHGHAPAVHLHRLDGDPRIPLVHRDHDGLQPPAVRLRHVEAQPKRHPRPRHLDAPGPLPDERAGLRRAALHLLAASPGSGPRPSRQRRHRRRNHDCVSHLAHLPLPGSRWTPRDSRQRASYGPGRRASSRGRSPTNDSRLGRAPSTLRPPLSCCTVVRPKPLTMHPTLPCRGSSTTSTRSCSRPWPRPCTCLRGPTSVSDTSIYEAGDWSTVTLRDGLAPLTAAVVFWWGCSARPIQSFDTLMASCVTQINWTIRLLIA